jgi:hypothetical protein
MRAERAADSCEGGLASLCEDTPERRLQRAMQFVLVREGLTAESAVRVTGRRSRG